MFGCPCISLLYMRTLKSTQQQCIKLSKISNMYLNFLSILPYYYFLCTLKIKSVFLFLMIVLGKFKVKQVKIKILQGDLAIFYIYEINMKISRMILALLRHITGKVIVKRVNSLSSKVYMSIYFLNILSVSLLTLLKKSKNIKLYFLGLSLR